LQEIFNELIDSYIESRVGISKGFLNSSLTSNLRENLIALYEGKQLTSAGTGDENHVVQNKEVRRDMIYWLDRKHDNRYENEFLDLMDQFVVHLNRTCYTGITGYEFHYALYEAGSFYKKHLDQFKNSDSRQYSMILYLNTEWSEDDGGELRIYHSDRFENIAPVDGKAVFFKSSEMEHEVLVTRNPRMSVTGWLRVNPLVGAIC
jgi:SM-20-related protein